MSFWTAQRIEHVTAGRWLSGPSEQAIERGVSIDSRTTEVGQVFFAVAGERFDGHDFLRPAADAGAALLVVSDEAKARGVVRLGKPGGRNRGAGNPGAGVGVLLVDDTIEALQQLATAYRDELRSSGTRVIAVTGSNGKTTTRRLIHNVLSAKLRGTESLKSFNNHIGVPLTLFGASTDDDFVAVEVGSNHPGEIDALARIIRPDVAVITNIGCAHIGHFGTREAIATEKSALLNHLDSEGVAVIPGDEDWPAGVFPIPEGVDVIKFGRGDSCDAHVSWVRENERGLGFSVNRCEPFRLPLLGEHNVLNATVAVVVGRLLGLRDELIAQSLTIVTPMPMRLEPIELCARNASDIRSMVIINDAYNANPDSVVQALTTLSRYPIPDEHGRRVAVLGDMFELGADGPGEHRQIGRSLAQFDTGLNCIHLAILIGALSACTAEELSCHWRSERLCTFPQWEESLPGKLAELVRPGDVVLIKASRGMGLERLIPALREMIEGL